MSFVPILESLEYSGSRVHPIGRPPKLTHEMIEKIADLIVIGKPISVAANLAGISESTIYRWLAMGKKKGANKIYRDLVERVYEACEFSEFEALQVLRQATLEGSNWRAAAWILERRHPEKYAKRSPQDENIESQNNK
jgi:transposase